MAWREAWRISNVAFTELSFQAIYAARQGNLPTRVEPALMVDRARRRVVQSKLLVSFLLAAIAVVGGLAVAAPHPLFGPVSLPRGLYVGGVLTGILVLDLALLWWSGLQVLPTLLGSAVLPFLETLPIESRTLDRAALLLFLRLFDGPAITCLVLVPLAIGVALGSPLAGLAIVPGVFAAVVFAFALALVTGRFFLRRVQESHGGGGHAVVRWVYLVLWAIPAFGIYSFVTVAPAFFGALAALVAHGSAAILNAALSAFPFPLALLPSLAVAPLRSSGFPGLSLVVVPVTAVVYGLAALYASVWLFGAPRRLIHLPPGVPETERAHPLRVVTSRVGWAILVKDLRTASRTPGYAFLILLPLLDAGVIGLYTYLSVPAPSDVFNLGAAAVATAALLATFFGPAFFAVEVMGYSYTRSLPVSDRSLLLGKVYLIAVLYLVASGLVLGLTLLRVFAPFLFLAFVFAELPAVLAAALLELGILFRRARKTGLPIVNLYAGAFWAIAVALPALFLAGLPLAVFQALRAEGSGLALPLMATIALAELGVFLPFALRGDRGRRR